MTDHMCRECIYYEPSPDTAFEEMDSYPSDCGWCIYPETDISKVDDPAETFMVKGTFTLEWCTSFKEKGE